MVHKKVGQPSSVTRRAAWCRKPRPLLGLAIFVTLIIALIPSWQAAQVSARETHEQNTAVLEPSFFTFAVTADQRSYTGSGSYDKKEYYRGVLEALVTRGGADFMVSPGDFDPGDGSRYTIDQILGTDFHWYPLPGNHELPGNGTDPETGDNFDYLRAYNYDPNGPGTPPDIVNTGPSGCPETTYSWEYENAHFVAINVYCDENGDTELSGDVSDHVYNWLVADLAATSKQHIFVFGHEPAFPQPDADNGDVRHLGNSLDAHTARRDRFWQLLADEGVVAYFCGHTHAYSAEKIDGVWQLDVGHARGKGETDTASTFVLIHIDGGKVTYETYRDKHDGTYDYNDFIHTGTLVSVPDPVNWIWSGAVTTNSAKINARLNSANENVRLAVSEQADLSIPTFYGPLVADASNNNTVSFAMTDLKKDTAYYYAIEAGGQLDSEKRGQFRTFQEGPFSFTFAFSGDAAQGSNMPIFDTVREENALFFISPGDLFYADIDENDVDRYRAAFEDSLSAARQSALYRSLPIAYMWDDHDYGSNNSDKTSSSREAARLAYREIVPHYDLPAAGSDAAVYQAFSVGRAYFILTDLRSEKDTSGSATDSGRSMMGAEQKVWFKQQLLAAKDQHRLIFWLSSVPWTAPIVDNEDDWGGYHAERVEIANFIKDNEIRNVFVLSADAHMLALDDGSNSDYATGGGAPVTVFQGAALNRGGSVKGGPYSHGTFPNPSADDGQYAVITVTDTGGSQIMVEYTGKRLPATTIQTINAEPEVLLHWESARPVAVSLVDFSLTSGISPMLTAVAGVMALLLLVTATLLRKVIPLSRAQIDKNKADQTAK